MEPRIQYAKTEDGVNIAYWTIGEGMPFIIPSGSLIGTSLQTWRHPAGRPFMERLAAHRMLVRYDSRGFGMSQGSEPDFSIESGLRDLVAVIGSIGEPTLDICGYFASGPCVLTYAERHPERISHLILYGTSTQGGTVFLNDATREALQTLADADLELFCAAIASAIVRSLGSSEDLILPYIAELRETMTQDSAHSYLMAQRVDVSDVLPEIQMPTLVLHRRGVMDPAMSDLQVLVGQIPNARLVLLDGASSVPFEGDTDAFLKAIDDFLGTTAGPTRKAVKEAETHTILFTDMEGSTTLADQLGDAAAQEVRRAHNEIVRTALSGSGGNEIKHTGDGIMASFLTASAALECAVAIQQGVASHRDEHPNSPLGVYVGLNAGEPIVEDDPDGRVDLFGTSINLAARICDHAEAGQILAANVVRELAAGKDFLFADLGETELRGFEDPVRLYEVHWEK